MALVKYVFLKLIFLKVFYRTENDKPFKTESLNFLPEIQGLIVIMHTTL